MDDTKYIDDGAVDYYSVLCIFGFKSAKHMDISVAVFAFGYY